MNNWEYTGLETKTPYYDKYNRIRYWVYKYEIEHQISGKKLMTGLKTLNNVKRTPEKKVSRNRLHTIWDKMMQRCYNKNNPKYRRYGGRGILVDERWHDVETFVYDLSLTHEEGLSLDRVNNDEGYSKNNTRWVTQKVQSNNTRANIKIDIGGVVKTLSEWCDISGVSKPAAYARIKKYDWNPEKAVTQKEVSKKPQWHEVLFAQGESLRISEWARRLGVKPDTLRNRLRGGMSHEEAVNTPFRKRKQALQ